MTRDIWARTSAGLIAAAVLWAMWPPLQGALDSGLPPLAAAASLMRMFTMTTNLLVGLVFGWIAWRGRDSVPDELVGGVMLAIVLVGVVFNLLLNMLPHLTIWYAIGDYLHHVFAPIAVPLWWLVFSRHGRLRWTAPLLWALYPLGYSALTVVHAQFMPMGTGLQARYPYFFMDADRLGWPAALTNMALIALGFVLVGFAAVAVDRALVRTARVAGENPQQNGTPDESRA